MDIQSDESIHLVGVSTWSLDHPKMVSQLVSLERRTSRTTGRELIDHPPGAHDDVANALAGAVHMVLRKRARDDDAGDLFERIMNRKPVWWWPPEWDLRWFDSPD